MREEENRQNEDGALEVEKALEVEVGARHPVGTAMAAVVILSLCWSLFQLSIAGVITLDAIRARDIHLAFAVALVFLTYPATKNGPRKYIPWYDWLLAIVAVVTVLYILFDYRGIASRPGAPLTRDIVFGAAGIIFLLEAARRSLGPALPIVAIGFILYAFSGASLPDLIAHRGYSVNRVVDHLFLTTEGIFGVPLGVSAAFVFLFVLFGALLEKAGAGKYFIDLAYSLLGGFRGGPAKAAILASGFTGMVNGSSVANTVTTGAFTIPLMKKVGYPAEKAAAIEVAASTNGQLMPPIMGAAAFIIAEFLGISYLEVVKAAIIPALASYMALFYISHLEALKLGLPKGNKSDLPPFLPTLLSGLHYMAPVSALVVSLLYYRLSPVTSAFNAIIILVIIMAIQRPMEALLNGGRLSEAVMRSCKDIYEGLIAGARNMAAIGVATAVAGIIVGIVTLTGLGLRAVEIVEVISMGSLTLALIITAITCLILGMGLPTTANYIVMATLTAPVIVAMADSAGFPVPLIAAHLFVFYFGILADDTPPVGLAAYAAAGIANADPIKTGIQGFMYDIRTAILPFMFIFNTELLLIGVDSWFHAASVLVLTVVGMFAFASATQGYALGRLSAYERMIFLLVALLLVNPNLFDYYIPVGFVYIYSLVGGSIYAFLLWRQWEREPS